MTIQMTNEAGITPEKFAILIAPFADDDHEFKPPRSYVYIRETPLCERIEQVDLSWEWRVETVNRYDTKGMIATTVGHLTICGVTRSGEGCQMVELQKGTDIESGEAEKGSETDALKRAARKFGIGRYLLECPKEVKGYGPDLNKWLLSVAKKQGVSSIAPIVSSPTAHVPATAHWSSDSAAMEKMYEWALKEHKATKNDVNALIAKTGKTILTLEKTAVMNAVKQWAIMQTVDALPVPDEYTMRMEGRPG